jgi:hypothetical protein
MKLAKELFDRASKAGKTKKPYLRLGEQLEGGGVKSTGAHTISIKNEKLGMGNNPRTNKEREELQMIVVENGIEKLWNVPVKDEDGGLHYLVQRLAEIEPDEEITVEMKHKGVKNYIDLRKVGEATDKDETGEETDGGVAVKEENESIFGEGGEFPF